MAASTERPASGDVPRGSWWTRVAWMIVIWSASVAALGVVSWILRLWLKP